MTVTSDDWAALEAQPGSVGTVVRRIHPESARDLHVGLDLSTRSRLLIFRQAWQRGRPLPTLPRTQALDCTSRVEQDGEAAVFTVVLREPALNDVFTAVVADLAAAVVDAVADEAATLQVGLRLSHWQDLFEALQREGLGQLERRGLVGELVVLRDVILPHLPPEVAIGGWTGPLKRNQDFQLSTVALEVKVTTGMQPQGFVVANERELDDTATGSLVLVHLGVDERQGGGGVTLPDLVEQVADALSHDAPAGRLFRERLARVGFVQAHAHLYGEPRYEVRAVKFFDVRGAFPRITEADLRDGVGRVKYEVSLDACADFEVELATVVERVSGGKAA